MSRGFDTEDFSLHSIDTITGKNMVILSRDVDVDRSPQRLAYLEGKFNDLPQQRDPNPNNK